MDGWLDPARTIHLIGDLHIGRTDPTRIATLAADIATVPTPAAHLQVGDSTELGTACQDTDALCFYTSLPAAWYTIHGNHDTHRTTDPGEGRGRTIEEWCEAYGYESANYTIDLGFCQIIAVGPEEPGRVALSLETVEWLDAQLTAATQHCVIACHPPLYDTVLGSPASTYPSTEPFFHAVPDAELRMILGAHENAAVWVSGHTHSPLDTPGLVKREIVEGRSLVSVNASAVAYTGRSWNPADPVVTAYLTFAGDRLQVRFRDHGQGVWVAPPPSLPRRRRELDDTAVIGFSDPFADLVGEENTSARMSYVIPV